VSGGYQEEDLVSDGWTDIIRNLLFLSRNMQAEGSPPEEAANIVQLADFRKMEQVRARVDAMVRDAKTAEALKPWYNQFCKRPCFHDEYLDAFNRPNVTLVDTKGKGVERITEKGIVAEGQEYEIDCLIYATGFEVGTSYTRRAGYELYGRDGFSLSEKWQDGIATLHGMHVHGFPNCFIMMNSQSGFTANFPHMMNEQSRHIGYILGECARRQAKRIEVTAEAESEWVDTVVSAAILRQKFFEECTPGYYNNEGKPSERAARNGPFGRGPIEFVRLLDEWRSEGTLKGLVLGRA
jgi:cyclohexanone monooxygenase